MTLLNWGPFQGDPSLAGASSRTKVPRLMSGHRTVAAHGERREVRATVRWFVLLNKAEFFQLKVLAFNQRLWIFCFIGVKTAFLY